MRVLECASAFQRKKRSCSARLATHEQAAILFAGFQAAKGQRESPVSSASDAPLEREARPPCEHLQGIVERLTYHDDHSGYTVARLKVASERDLVTIVGHFPSITAGQTLRLTGFW